MVTATATREVILCAGAIGTPQILQLSGIGPARCCSSTASRPVHELPGVGANLQDHLQIRAVFKVQGVKTLNTLANSLWGKARIGLEYALEAERPDEHGAQPARRLHPQRPDAALPEHRIPRAAAEPGRLRRAAARLPGLHRQRLQPEPHQPGHGADQVRPVRGRAGHCAQLPQHRRRPQGRRRQPARDAQDRCASRRWRSTKPEEFKPGVQFQSDEELARLAGDIASTIFHPVGTTKMGRADDPMAVVDAACGCAASPACASWTRA